MPRIYQSYVPQPLFVTYKIIAIRLGTAPTANYGGERLVLRLPHMSLKKSLPKLALEKVCSCLFRFEINYLTRYRRANYGWGQLRFESTAELNRGAPGTSRRLWKSQTSSPQAV